MGAERLLRRLAYLWSRQRHDDDLAEELPFHRELMQARLEREGCQRSGFTR